MRFTFSAIMFGLVQDGFEGTTGRSVAEVMELSAAQCVSRAGVFAVGPRHFLRMQERFLCVGFGGSLGLTIASMGWRCIDRLGTWRIPL